jgi:hypothetical protein
MLRIATVVGFLAAFVAFAVVHYGPVNGEQAPGKQSKVAPPRPRAMALAERLYQPFPITEPMEKVPLRDVLAFLEERAKVDLSIFEPAFNAENVAEVASTPISLKRQRSATLAETLQEILKQIPAPSGATFLVRANHVAITTGQSAQSAPY